jgi:hypothetical protein
MDKETYLGDAVYASFDGYQIWLRTGDGNDNRIALEPEVFRALIDYANRLRAAATAPVGDGGG